MGKEICIYACIFLMMIPVSCFLFGAVGLFINFITFCVCVFPFVINKLGKLINGEH
jgi:hypothetical protein